METYIVNNKEYKTICSIHNELKMMILEFVNHVDKRNEMIELVSVANDMAHNMESALNAERTPWGTINLFNLSNLGEDEI